MSCATARAPSSPQPLWTKALLRPAASVIVLLGPLILLRAVGWIYPLELLAHFQVQYLLAAVACTVVVGGLRSWRWFGAGLVCVALAGWAVVPFLVGRPASPTDATTVRLLVANVHTWNREHQKLLDFVAEADADVLVLLEVNARWMEALEALEAEYPHSVSGPREDNFGLSVRSRLAIEDATIEVFADTRHPSVSLTLTPGGRRVSLLATHPVPPIGYPAFARRNAHLTAASAFARGLPRPLVLAGDLNTTTWSPWYRRLAKPNGLTSARRGFGILATWPAQLPAPLRLPIDHCLISDELAVADCRLGPDIGSDHLPLVVDIVVPSEDS